MLQLIGFVLCGAMFAHGVSIYGNGNYRSPDENGHMKMSEAGNMAGGLFIAAAMAFALWFYILGMQVEGAFAADSYEPSSTLSDAELEKSAAEAVAAADAADKAAREALAGAGQ